MDDAVVGKIKETVANIFDVSLDEVSEEPFPEAMESWDLVAHLNLILAREQQFSVTFNEEAIAELVTVDAIAQAVSEQI